MTGRDGPEVADLRIGGSPVPAPAAVAVDQAFDGDGLYSLRAAVAAHALDLGLPEDRLPGLVLAASELATNAIRHGGGTGRLLLWLADERLHFQVSDSGPGIANPRTAGAQRAPLNSHGGRGLWIVRRICDQVHIATGATGTTITAAVRLVGDAP